MKRTVLIILSTLVITACISARLQRPQRLMTDMLEHTDIVFQDGYISSMPIEQIPTAIERIQIPFITSSTPHFSWQMKCETPDTYQTAYRILVASSRERANELEADMWDSGIVNGSSSVSIKYEGKELLPGKPYYWTVKVFDNHDNISEYAETKAFVMAETVDNSTPSYPLQYTDDHPSEIRKINDCESFIIFDKTAFGRLFVTLDSETDNDSVIIRLGEKCSGGRLFRKAEGNRSSVRYAEYPLRLRQGRHTYVIKIKPDKRNTDLRRANESMVLPVLMPGYMGEVFPFRFIEIDGYGKEIGMADITRQCAHYPFNDHAAYFQCSDSILNMIWDLSKYTVKATSFCGIYVDGDRERIAYEADAVIGQLGHYSTDLEPTMARKSLEYMLDNPTWPTEWNLQSIIIAWNDYMYTGDNRLLVKYYDLLKNKTLCDLRDKNGLISTRTGNVTPEFYYRINFKGKKLKDIVDWPQSGYIGSEKERPGEADGFKRTDYNTVVNAYHYNALKLMAQIASAIGKYDDSDMFRNDAEYVKKCFNSLLLNNKSGVYKDGVGTDHESLHGNMFPLAFGLAPDKYKHKIIDYIKSRRMACSVYGAQFLLDALYQENEADYALSLLSSTGERSWYNMIKAGSTITMEAWDDKYKPNQDWNHIWGAAPANIIPRGIFGIIPLEPGFKKFQIKLQPSCLEWAEIKHPTMMGDIYVKYMKENAGCHVVVSIPANTSAEVYIPCLNKNKDLFLNGKRHSASFNNNYINLNLGSGVYI